MAVLYVQHYFQGLDNDGNPLSGGMLYTYEAGTNTPKATFTDAAESAQHPNPIILNSAGLPETGDLFLSGSYKFVLHDADDVPLAGRETDNITSFTTSSNSVGDINALTSATIAATDEIAFADVSDSNTVKKDTVQGILDLVTTSGAWVPLQTQTVSSAVASVDFTSGIDGTYKAYAVVFSSVKGASASVFTLRMGNGGSFDSGASDYDYVNVLTTTTGSSPANSFDAANNEIFLTDSVGTNSQDSANGIVYLCNMDETALYSQVHGRSIANNTGTRTGIRLFSGQRLEAAAHDRVQFLFTSGNITAGTFTLYGLAGA